MNSNLLNNDTFFAEDRQVWRNWLETNFDKCSKVWLIYYKKSSRKVSLTYNEAVEEALCFGWIDSITRTIDNERYMQLFTPRKENSNWSKSNKERVEKLIAQNLMTFAGLRKIEIAKTNGKWDAYNEIENLILPTDFKSVLENNILLLQFYNSLSTSQKKSVLHFLNNVKTKALRQKRIDKLIIAFAENKLPDVFYGYVSKNK